MISKFIYDKKSAIYIFSWNLHIYFENWMLWFGIGPYVKISNQGSSVLFSFLFFCFVLFYRPTVLYHMSCRVLPVRKRLRMDWLSLFQKDLAHSLPRLPHVHQKCILFGFFLEYSTILILPIILTYTLTI